MNILSWPSLDKTVTEKVLRLLYIRIFGVVSELIIRRHLKKYYIKYKFENNKTRFITEGNEPQRTHFH